jgi:hypothetical protein
VAPLPFHVDRVTECSHDHLSVCLGGRIVSNRIPARGESGWTRGDMLTLMYDTNAAHLNCDGWFSMIVKMYLAGRTGREINKTKRRPSQYLERNPWNTRYQFFFARIPEFMGLLTSRDLQCSARRTEEPSCDVNGDGSVHVRVQTRTF